MLTNLRRKTQNISLISNLKRSYTKMKPEECLKNVRDGLTNQTVQNRDLKPLLEANHTSDTRTHLYGMPVTPQEDGGFVDNFVGAVGRT